ncbi:MAG: hypothetical protein ACREPM_10355, partial [Gemmatimonadaceae bacterium]
RYRADFVYRAHHAVSSEQVVLDLARVVAPHSPARVVIDSISPFFVGAGSLQPVAVALAEWFGRIGSCSMLTFSEDLGAEYDRDLEPLVQSAAAIVRLVREDADMRRAELVTLRHPAPASAIRRFAIYEQLGAVAELAVRGDRLALKVP